MHATVCDYIADLVHNAVEAGATRVGLEIETRAEHVAVTVEDNGHGMDAAQLQRAANPFFSEPGKHDHRRVGLGLPLLRQAAEATHGSLDVRSAPGQGTTVAFRFDSQHVDVPPLGDLAGTLLTLMALPGGYDLAVRRSSPAGNYAIARHELQDTLGDMENAANLSLARQYLAGLEQELEAPPTTPATRPGATMCTNAAGGCRRAKAATRRPGRNNHEQADA